MHQRHRGRWRRPATGCLQNLATWSQSSSVRAEVLPHPRCVPARQQQPVERGSGWRHRPTPGSRGELRRPGQLAVHALGLGLGTQLPEDHPGQQPRSAAGTVSPLFRVANTTLMPRVNAAPATAPRPRSRRSHGRAAGSARAPAHYPRRRGFGCSWQRTPAERGDAEHPQADQSDQYPEQERPQLQDLAVLPVTEHVLAAGTGMVVGVEGARRGRQCRLARGRVAGRGRGPGIRMLREPWPRRRPASLGARARWGGSCRGAS